MNKKLSFDTFTVTGKRKRALAKATIKSGSGKIKMNLRPIEFLSVMRRLYIQEPIRLVEGAGMPINFDISVKVTGGGPEGQVEAARLAIARSIVKFAKSPEIRKIFLNYDRNMMIQDTRRKEDYKPNDSKARAARQKSYR